MTNFSVAAQANIEETGIDPADDIEAVRTGAKSATSLLDECLSGADRDRVQGWREYVDAVVEAARAQRDVVEAIGRSISHNEIVHLPWTQERQGELAAQAAEEGGGSVDAGEVYEFWGAPGNAWRVHLDRK